MHKSDSIFVDFNIKEKIRKTKLSGTEIGGASSFPFMKENDNPSKPLIALEIPYNIDDGYPDIIKEKWQGKSLPQILEEADNSNADIISIKFNISENLLNEKISEIKDFLKNTASKIKKPLILRGANNNSIDVKLIPLLAQNAPKESIIAFADEETYEQIVPYVTKYNHILVLRTPIDINLAKELNILSIDKGMRPERILIDPDMGGLGYGLDYGYSIIEKIKQAAFDGDTMLNMPIIAFIGEESYRAKEAKTDAFEKNWGDYKERSSMWEISGASAMISAGADIVVLWNPDSIKSLKRDNIVELTGLQIFKYLPGAKKAEGTNCKKCGCPTCMAYALKLAKKQTDIEKCPHIPDELKEKFSEASKIQQHEIKLSDNLVTGGETVMFRHDKTFVNKTVIAIHLDADASDFDTKLEKIKNYHTERIGETFKADAVYLTGTNKDIARKKLQNENIAVIPDDSLYSIAKGNNIEELEQESKKLLAQGKQNIILELEYGKKSVAEIAEQLTYIRRAAIIKRYEPLTYPVMVKLPQNIDTLQACAVASLLICRYANIVVLNDFNEALLTTLFTLRQNIYTNPQKPLQVEAKIYEFNEPDRNAPVLLTTNFALTYFAVAGELESLPCGSYLVVTPSDGMSVLTAWSADKFTADLVAKSVKDFELAKKVDTRSIIIPGLLSHMKDELQEAMPEWNIVSGTIEACQIPEFLKNRESL